MRQPLILLEVFPGQLMSRIVFLNRYFPPDRSATSQILGDVAYHLAASGHEVSVIASQQLYDQPRRGSRRTKSSMACRFTAFPPRDLAGQTLLAGRWIMPPTTSPPGGCFYRT